MLNKESALRIENGICGGFKQPTLAWSLTTVDHLDDVPYRDIVSNFWIGEATQIKFLANYIVDCYKDNQEYDEDFLTNLEINESVSVLFWIFDNFAMCAEVSTTNKIDITSSLSDIYENTKQVLTSSNPNKPEDLFNNTLLSTDEKVLISHFITQNFFDKIFLEENLNLLMDLSDNQRKIIKEFVY